MQENLYDRAASIWVARKFNLDEDKVSNVDFKVVYGGYCETCGYETLGLSYQYDGQYRDAELSSLRPGHFIEECVEILKTLQ